MTDAPPRADECVGLVHLLTKGYGLVLAILLILALALVAPAAAVDIPVDNSSATAIQDNVTRAASGDTLVLAPGTYFERDITITGKSLTFRADTANGHGPLDTILDANRAGRIFYVSDGSSLAIDNLSLRNGKGPASFHGGAIYGRAVTVTSSIITGCSVTSGSSSGGNGGAIYGETVTVINSTITGCSAGSGDSTGGSGGAIYGSTVTLTNSTITSCLAGSGGFGGGNGGAIRGSTVTVTTSTITGCSAGSASGLGPGGSGGAIYSGMVTVTDSAITGCSGGSGSPGGYGGAICGGPVTVTASTITGCTAGSGGGNGGSGGAIRGTTVNVATSTITGCTAGGSGVTPGAGGAIAVSTGGTVSFSRIVHNDGVGVAVSGPLTATNTWWGSDASPSSGLAGGATYSPWLVTGITTSPASVSTTETSVIRANLTYHSDGAAVTAASGTVPDGTPVTFSATGGTVSPVYVGTENGIALTTFTPSGTGTAYLTATIDQQSITVPVTVTTPAAGTNVTSIVIDPLAPATVYAGVDNRGIYRTTNGGTLWLPAAIQPANKNIRALVINPANPTHLYAGTYGGGLNRSTDSGDKWGPCGNTGLDNLNVLSLVTNSTGTLYAGTEGGVFTSTDCDSWTALNNGLP
jgi:hypothetical protein